MANYSNFDLRKFISENKITNADSITPELDKKLKEEISLAHESELNEMDGSSIDLLMGVLGSAGIISASIGITEFMERAKAGKYGPKVQKLVMALEKKAGEVNRATGNTHEEVEESAPGFDHDCAAHVVHESHGYGVCIEGKHTLVETENGHEVTHYDVFFKSGNTVKNIPVNELKVMTSESHTHKKNKKKNEEVAELTKEQAFKKEIKNLLDS